MTAATIGKKSLHERVLAAAAAAGYVQKTGHNPQGWKFAGDEAISEKFREALLAEGLLCYPNAIKYDEITILPRQGKDVPNVLVSCSGEFVITDGIASIVVAALGQGMDVGDKAAYKALTGMKKYAYRMAVMMVTGDDPDSESPADTAREADDDRFDRIAGNEHQASSEPSTAQFNKMFGMARDAGFDLDTTEGADAFKTAIFQWTGKRKKDEIVKDDLNTIYKNLEETKAVMAATGSGTVVS